MTGITAIRVAGTATARGLVVALCAALALVGCSSGSAASASGASTASMTPAAVTSAPVRTVRTADGTVGYRWFGTGPALVLITGYGASIDSWDPTLLALLARSHRVVVPDNAGVGKTSPLPGPLSIDAMAQQASAFITALGLGKPAVLGWSMGGMIAQALAVLHPAQVSRLVLAATQAGNGKAQPVPTTAAAALSSGNGEAILSVLFPHDQAAAARTYARSISAYPGYYQAPKSAEAAQSAAIAQWFAGKDPAGPRVSKLTIPTLVADGSQDALDPAANDRQLAALIPDATLRLYPDAGHAFLMQDETEFAAQVAAFTK